MIANCGHMGMDWQTASMSDYFEALEATNEAQKGNERAPLTQDQIDRIKRLKSARADA